MRAVGLMNNNEINEQMGRRQRELGEFVSYVIEHMMAPEISVRDAMLADLFRCHRPMQITDARDMREYRYISAYLERERRNGTARENVVTMPVALRGEAGSALNPVFPDEFEADLERLRDQHPPGWAPIITPRATPAWCRR